MATPLRLPILTRPDVHQKCGRCGGHCCTYLALEIDSPRTYDDWDNIRWYVAHRTVQVYKEGRRWYLQVETRCGHLSDGGLCGIYETRPQVCRDFGVDDCEFENSQPFGYAYHFTRSEEVEAQMNRRWPKGRPGARRRAGTKGAAS